VLFISGYAGEDVIQRGLLEPGSPFQQKPFAVEHLARKVRDMLDGAGGRAGSESDQAGTEAERRPAEPRAAAARTAGG
jgi:hypothetical protein